MLLPYDEAVALVWGELQARAQHRGRPRPDNDTWIAASCLVHGLPLATFNVKDFSDLAVSEGFGWSTLVLDRCGRLADWSG